MEFALARPEHEPELRELLRTQPMPGWVRLTYEREPDYFRAAATQGSFHQTIVALQDGRVVGTGSRAVREMFVDGVARPFGYLGGLRSREWVRGGTGLARGYAFLRQLHGDGRAPAYLTTIIEDNDAVRRLLTSRRAGLPHYLDLGRLLTHVIGFGWRTPGRRPRRDLRLARARSCDAEEVCRFLREQGARRQFFPVVHAAGLGTPLWRNLGAEDFHVARAQDGALLGAVGCWDPSSFKQVRVTGYCPPLRCTRILANLALRCLGHSPLPPQGTRLRPLMLCLVCIRDDDPAVLAALLDHIQTTRRSMGFHNMCLGLHERDPLTAAVSPGCALRYSSRLYGVCWDDGCAALESLDASRIPHLEIATL